MPDESFTRRNLVAQRTRHRKMIIDFHTHCFPDTLAPRALAALHDHVLQPDIFPCTDGTQAGTEAHIAKSGVDAAVICNIATNPRQMSKVNGFAASLSQNSKSLYALGSIHPDGEDKRGELEGLRAAGIRGIKIHPDYMGRDIDSGAYDEIFSLCSELDFFVLTHAGLDPVSPDHLHAPPAAIAAVLDRYPRLRLIAAHMGGFECSDDTIKYLLGRDVWLDTSMSSQRPGEREKLLMILRSHPADRLLFGSDTPWSFIADELDFLRSASLDLERLGMILGKNALALLEGE